MTQARFMLLVVGTAFIFSGSLPAKTWKTSLGRTFEAEFEKLEQEISAAWAKMGVEIQFDR
jgi:hypothetical protein